MLAQDPGQSSSYSPADVLLLTDRNSLVGEVDETD